MKNLKSVYPLDTSTELTDRNLLDVSKTAKRRLNKKKRAEERKKKLVHRVFSSIFVFRFWIVHIFEIHYSSFLHDAFGIVHYCTSVVFVRVGGGGCEKSERLFSTDQ